MLLTHVPQVLAFHSQVDATIRFTSLKTFLNPPVDDTRLVLVTTDRASVGLDTSYVEHVILFEFPHDPSEFIRRVGRTGRGANGSGVVSILALGT